MGCVKELPASRYSHPDVAAAKLIRQDAISGNSRENPPCFATSGPKARRKFWGILMQNPLEIVVFQWKIAQERVRNAKKIRLRRAATQKRHLYV